MFSNSLRASIQRSRFFRFKLPAHILYVLEDHVINGNGLGNQLLGMFIVAAAGFGFGQPRE
jgi:hypothetical protein